MDKKVKVGVIAVAVGIVSLVLSIRAFIIDYEVWKANGGDIEVEEAPVPTWISVWMQASLVLVLLGCIWVIVALILHKRAKNNVIDYEDYVGMPHRKYWIGIVLIAASVLVAVASAALSLTQWYIDSENAFFLFIALAVPGASLALLFLGTIRLIDDVVINSRIGKAQQKFIA